MTIMTYFFSTICWVLMSVMSTFTICSTSKLTFCLITSLHSVSTFNATGQ